MSKSTQEHIPLNLQRRQFLTGLTLAVAASAVSTSATSSVMPSPEVELSETSSTQYRETQHVRDYYDSL